MKHSKPCQRRRKQSIPWLKSRLRRLHCKEKQHEAHSAQVTVRIAQIQGILKKINLHPK